MLTDVATPRRVVSLPKTSKILFYFSKHLYLAAALFNTRIFARSRQKHASIELEASALIWAYGDGAYKEAMRAARDANALSSAWYWRLVSASIRRRRDRHADAHDSLHATMTRFNAHYGPHYAAYPAHHRQHAEREPTEVSYYIPSAEAEGAGRTMIIDIVKL